MVVIDDDVGWVERALGGSNFVRKRLLRQVTAEQQRAGRAAEQGRTQQTCVGSRLASRISPEHVGDRHPFDQSNPIVFTESTFLSFIYVPSLLLSFPHFKPCLPLHNCQVPHLDPLHLRPRRPLVERSHKVRDVRIRALRLAGDAVVRSVTDPAADGETVGDLVGEGTAGRLAIGVLLCVGERQSYRKKTPGREGGGREVRLASSQRIIVSNNGWMSTASHARSAGL